MISGVDTPRTSEKTCHIPPLKPCLQVLLFFLMFFCGCAQAPEKDRPYISKTRGPAAVKRLGYITHKVRHGETVWAISQRYNLSPQTVIQINGIKDVRNIKVGQELLIPRTASLPHASPASVSGAVTSAPVSAKGFVWPLNGRILQQYDDIVNGHKNTGIDIETQLGQDVFASKGGVVEVVTENPDGWGKVVVIKHSGGIHTWYAHNSKVFVRKGNWVRRGQRIAQAGQSGSVTRPGLHFKVFRNDKPVNPLSYLPRR